MSQSRSGHRSVTAHGNDVVDLAHPRCTGKHEDERFLRRVFTPAERGAIRSDARPHDALWRRWAAKEAAFKVITKLRGAPPPFVLPSFQVELGVGRRADGRVLYQQLQVPVRVEGDAGGWIHAVAEGPQSPKLAPDAQRTHARVAALGATDAAREARADDLSALFSARELAAIHSPASAQVRLGARRDIAQALGVEKQRLEIICPGVRTGRSPPVVLLDGKEARANVSLSHHGRWVAWVVTSVIRPAES